MTKRSGWCSNYAGTCTSPRAHQTCQQRINNGWIQCECAAHGGHENRLANAAETCDNETSPQGASTPAGSDHPSLPSNERG